MFRPSFNVATFVTSISLLSALLPVNAPECMGVFAEASGQSSSLQKAAESTDKHVLHKLSDPLTLKLTTAVSATQTQFEAELPMPHTYDEMTLPTGTRFKGSVVESQTSKPLGRAGYISLLVNEVTLPNGETFKFDLEQHRPPEEALHHPKAATVQRTVKNAIPFSAVSFADGIPLKYAAGLSTPVIIPISLGARMALGVALEARKHDDRQMKEKVSYGAFRGTGIPGLYKFVKRSPEADFQPGDLIHLKLDPAGLSALMQLAAKTSG